MKFNTHYIYPQKDCESVANLLIQLVALKKKVQAIVRILFYFHPADKSELSDFSKAMKSNLLCLGFNEVPFTIICQEPADDVDIVAEVLTVNDKNANIEYCKYADVNFTRIVFDSGEFLYATNTSYKLASKNSTPSADDAFKRIEDILTLNEMNFSNVIKQWNYIENILSEKTEYQEYQLFNEVRNNYYKKYNFANGYPAATGIGTFGGGVLIEVIAFKAANDQYLIENLHNNYQTEAYNYSQSKLQKGYNSSIKSPPLFVRGKSLSIKDQVSLFISGTASILGEDTVHIEDFERQVYTTMWLINKLIDENMSLSNKPESASSFRIYLKNKNFLNTAKSICEKVENKANFNYLIADICRDNLLVEIEQIISYQINTE